MIHDCKAHKGAVTSVRFHPKEFLMATGSSDRTAKFWDLERFDLVSETSVESSGIRCIHFHPEGSVLFTGSQESLRVSPYILVVASVLYSYFLHRFMVGNR